MSYRGVDGVFKSLRVHEKRTGTSGGKKTQSDDVGVSSAE